MPPKKKSSAKNPEENDRELLQEARAEIVALKRVMELKTFEAVEARALERSWRERAELAEAALEQAKADMADIKADMTRQQSSIQEQSNQQVLVLEARMCELQGRLTAAQQTADRAEAQFSQLQQDLERQASGHQQEVQRLHQQFAALLQDTLSTVRARLEEEACAACGVS